MKRPNHKVAKPKYKSENGDIQYDREVNPLTMEDNFSKFDTPWLAVLRDRNHSAQTAATTKRKKLLGNTIPQPPSFYEDDMGKWDQKFKKTIQERDDFKKKYLKDTQLGITREPNDKIMEKIEKRRKSRLSTNTFNVVDFDYHGNTNSFSHLIKNKFKEPPTVSQLNFECRLRTYKSKSEYKHRNNWVNAFSKHNVNIPKNSDGKPPIPQYKRTNKQKGREEELSDKYREANANNMTHLFTKVFSKNSLKWEVGLRSYHPDYQDCFRFTNSKFHISNLKNKQEEKQVQN